MAINLTTFRLLQLALLGYHAVAASNSHNLRRREQRDESDHSQSEPTAAVLASHDTQPGFRIARATVDETLSTTSLHNLQTIKQSLKHDKIYGGVDAQPLDAPFFVMMLRWNDDISQYEFDGCGGSLISDRHVLTAGHCGKERVPLKHAAYVQAYQPFQGNPGVPYHFSRIANYTIHPDFDDATNANDLSIVTLESPVKLGQIAPVRLAGPYLNVWPSEMVQVYGFGWTSYESRALVPTLQKTSLPFIPRNDCKSYYGSHVKGDMVCAGYRDGGRDACNGDSGGTMSVRKNEQVFQVGVVSWGQGCGEAGRPGVYISVQYHYKWIQSTVCRNLSNMTASPLCENYQPPAVYEIADIDRCSKKKLRDRCRYHYQCCSGVCAKKGRKWGYGTCAAAPSW